MSPAEEHVGSAIQPIIGGFASSTDQDAVVVVAHFEGGIRRSLCTGTMIAPNLLVTARHCVTATDGSVMCGQDGTAIIGAQIHADYDAASLAVFTGAGGAAAASDDETQAGAHGQSLVVDDATSLCNHDLAFLVLDRALETPIAPIRLAPPSPSELITAVGWGVTETGGLPETRQQRASLTILGDGPLAFPDDARYGVGASELLLGESACSGDSGSPVLSTSGAVLGVASRAGNGLARDPNNISNVCTGNGVHAVYTHLGNAQALVTRAFGVAGAKPWLEGAPDPRTTSAPTADLPPSASDAPTAQEAKVTVPAESASPEETASGEKARGGCTAAPASSRSGSAALVIVVAGVLARRRKRVSGRYSSAAPPLKTWTGRPFSRAGDTMDFKTGCLWAACLTSLGCSGATPNDNVEPTVEIVSRGASALGAGTIKWINGTYTGCSQRSGSWSTRVSGVATMDNAALSVVLNDTSCVVAVTQIVADQTYVAAAGISLTAAFPASATAFAPSGGGATSFYGNAKMSATGFGADFQLSFYYSDNLSAADAGAITGTYATVQATAQAFLVAAPDYTLSLTAGTAFTTQIDAAKNVVSIGGNVTLTDGLTVGDHYVVDMGTLGSGVTYAGTGIAYLAGTERTISGSNPTVPASQFGLVGVSLASPVVRTLIVAHTVNGVKGYQLFKITFQ